MFKSILLVFSIFGCMLKVGSVGVNQTLSEFREEALKAHNAYREQHNAAPLTFDPELNRLATEWAKYLALLGILHHRTDRGNHIGENIFLGSGFTVKGKTAVDYWMREEKNYNNPTGKSKNGKSIGDFTQVIWKSSKKLGIGFGTNSQGTTYVVANYKPSGNWIGQYNDNVE